MHELIALLDGRPVGAMPPQRSMSRPRSSRRFRRQDLDRDRFKFNLVASHLPSGLSGTSEKPIDQPGAVQARAEIQAGMSELGWASRLGRA
jgi:hypothetical protein